MILLFLGWKWALATGAANRIVWILELEADEEEEAIGVEGLRTG